MPNLSPQRHDPALLALGGAIRRLRAERKMSQEQLALAASADRSHIGRIERGENEITVLLLLRIAGALETSLAEMMTEAKL